ncbi:phospholipid carrier-dependent glycosyltransferase [Hirschia maritima]|uniref:phospholipid carrier-dependent glycosyltransferase n=1 Tax=Hirschia maritima TaxID=1121961 RepID=UPI00035C5979|nr:phospholipid carrier-dependent glycosyltransferase [Hirschia maritima]
MFSSKSSSISTLDWVWSVVIACLASLAICWRLDIPASLVFDETHYVPAGQQLFQLEAWTNNSHPPFGKWLIGLGSSLADGASWGWRLPGAILGVLSICSVYAAMRLFRFSISISFFAAILTLLNQTLLVQSRTAMLDIYSLGFFVLSALALIWSGKRARSRSAASIGLVISGIFLGLAASSKWSAGINMVLIWGGLFIWRCSETSPKGYFLPRLFGTGFAGWYNFSFLGTGLRQGVPAIATYCLTFLPFIWMEGNFSLLELHQRMLADVTSVLKEHPYQSQWWEWPLMFEPIWYYFEKPDPSYSEAIFLIGNPLVYWAGLPAILFCFGYGTMRHDGALLAISSAFMGCWLVYAVIPRDLMFSYYYEQAAFFLGMGIAAFVSRCVKPSFQNIVMVVWMALAIASFVFFYPVLTAMPFEGDEWLKWVWFRAWT